MVSQSSHQLLLGVSNICNFYSGAVSTYARVSDFERVSKKTNKKKLKIHWIEEINKSVIC